MSVYSGHRRDSSDLSCLERRSQASTTLMGLDRSVSGDLGPTNSWGREYFHLESGSMPLLVGRSSTNTQGSRDTPKRRLAIKRDQLLAYQLYANDIDFVGGQNDYFNAQNLLPRMHATDLLLVHGVLVPGYTLRAPLTQRRLSLLLFHATRDIDGTRVLVRVLPELSELLHVARFLNEWYVTSCSNAPLGPRLWTNAAVARNRSAPNILDPAQRRKLRHAITLPPDLPGVLYPERVVNIDVDVDGENQRRVALVFADRGLRTLRDFHAPCSRGRTMASERSGSLRPTLSEVSADRPPLVRMLAPNNLGSGGFDDLANRVSQQPKTSREIIEIVLDVAAAVQTLATCHDLGVVHNGITSHHVLHVSGQGPSDTTRVVLTGWDFAFTIAGEDAGEAFRRKNLSDIPDLLPYMSPENTGETIHLVDLRTDIYSMGIVLYELIVGCLPFQSDSPVRLRRMHLNERPISPATLGLLWLPQRLSDIIMRCLEKTPTDRYPEAHTLHRDLLAVVDELTLPEGSNSFSNTLSAQISASDACRGNRPSFHSLKAVLHQESDTRNTVLNCFNSHNDGVRYIVVHGDSGSGKTTLIDEIQCSAVSKYNFVIPWGYNCADMNVTPYASAIFGMLTIVAQILASSKENIAEWRHIFTSEIDMDMSILFSAIPGLRILLGPKYEGIRSDKTRTVYPSKEFDTGVSLSDLTDIVEFDDDEGEDEIASPTEVIKGLSFDEQNIELRFNYIIKKVFALVAGRRLTIVLDNIQWCPRSELALIRDIVDHCLIEAESPSICIIGAYNTSTTSSPYDRKLVEMSEVKETLLTDEVEYFEFEMSSLSFDQFKGIYNYGKFPTVVDATRTSSLLRSLYEKTCKNRLHFTWFMRYFYLLNGSKRLTFEEMEDSLNLENMPKTQVEILQKVFNLVLMDLELMILKFASIIGSNGVFRLSDLMIVSGQSLSEVYETLQFCIEMHLVIPSGTYYKIPYGSITQENFPFDFPDSMIWELTTKTKYRFDHDSVQMALLLRMQEMKEWAQFHGLCGLRFQRKLSTEVSVNVSNYLSMCTHLLYSCDVAREQDFEKYYDALVTGGRYALATSNLEIALLFFTASSRFIKHDDKRRKVRNMLTICQTNYYLKNFDDCIKVIQQAEEELGGDSKSFLFLKIRCLFHQKQYKIGMQKAVDALRSLDVEISLDHNKCESISKKYLSRIPLSVTEIRAMKKLRRATNQEFLLIVTLILDMIGPSYILGLSQLRLALLTQIILLMNKYGRIASCALPLLHLANYYIQPHEHMSTVKATELSDFSLFLINSYDGASTNLSRVINECYIIFMASFRTNTNELLRYSDQFDFIATGMTRPLDNSLALLVVASGLLLNITNGNTSVLQTKQSLFKIVHFDTMLEYDVFGKGLSLWQNTITFEEYAKDFQTYRTMKRPDLEFPYLANAILWCVSEGRYKEGTQIFLERGYHVLRKLPISIVHLEVYFYASICLCFNDSASNKSSGLQLAMKIMKMFETWSTACYGNFGPKRLILDACIKCNSTGQSSLAVLDSFEEAIDGATREGRWVDVALSNHLCASWLLHSADSKRRAGFFAQKALSMYTTMKAERQVERITLEFASVFSSFNWAGLEILPETLKFGDGEQLNKKLKVIFNDENNVDQMPNAFRRDSIPNSVDDRANAVTSDPVTQTASQSELSQAIKLCLTISESSNIDSIVTSLLESILQFSSVDYGVIVLNSLEGEPSIRAIGTLNNLYKLDNDPLSLRTDLVPYMLLIHCLLTGEVVNKEANPQFFHERFGTDHYYTHNPCSSAIALPIKTSTVLGMIYLERHSTGKKIHNNKPFFDHKIVDLLDLLSSQAAVAFSKSIVYSQMEIAKKTAEDATAEKASFLANMSHEIRTPFNSLFACSVFLLDTELNSTQREYVQTIKNSALVTLSIIDGILAFSKIEHGSFTLENVPFSINEIIESAIQVSSEQADTGEVELVFFNDCPDIESVAGDSTRIRQIIINLVGNAVKFTTQGHIIVTLSAEQIAGQRYDVKVTVEDTGIGIPKGSRSKVFGVFSQVDGSSRRVYGGTGLGLAISKKLADIMNGKITFESEEGIGSVFTFRCPLEVQLTDDSPKFGSKKIAIASRSKLKKESFRRFLEYYGTHVTLFDTFHDLVSSKSKYDMVFVGASLLKSEKIDRQALGQPSCKFILISKFGLVYSEEVLDRMKVDALIFTPVTRSKIERVLDTPSVKPGKAAMNGANGKRQLLGEIYPLRILIAEDNAINLRVALQHLKKLGYIADHAKDGVEAVEQCEVQLLKGEKYDVVFMDIQMPRKDGIAATEEIHEMYHGLGRPDLVPRIVALTANVAGEDRQKCLECGMMDFVSKPILPERLQQVLTKVSEDITNSLLLYETE